MHEAAVGAPKGNRNALKHGGFTTETVALRKEIAALDRLARETMAAIDPTISRNFQPQSTIPARRQ
jgi:hypothetical protein